MSAAPGARGVVMVKLGGSVITDKDRPDTVRADVLTRLSGEIAGALPALDEALVVGHGSGSFGHTAAARHGIHHGLRSPEQRHGLVETQGKASELHRLVLSELRAAGVPAYSVRPSSFAVAAGGRAAAMDAEVVALALEAGLVPVVCGDVVLDREQGVAILSTEEVFLGLTPDLGARGWPVRRVLWLGATDGLLDASGRTVSEVSAGRPTGALRAAGSSPATDVTGGMALRLETAVELARRGVPSWIGDGRAPGRLSRALSGGRVPGTRVVP